MSYRQKHSSRINVQAHTGIHIHMDRDRHMYTLRQSREIHRRNRHTVTYPCLQIDVSRDRHTLQKHPDNHTKKHKGSGKWAHTQECRLLQWFPLLFRPASALCAFVRSRSRLFGHWDGVGTLQGGQGCRKREPGKRGLLRDGPGKLSLW